MKRAIVTGANGFIGSAVVNKLSSEGIQVWAVVKNEGSDIAAIETLHNVKIVYCELSKLGKLPQLIQERGFDAFYHFAWVGSAGPLRGDYQTQLLNAQWTCEAVKVCKQLYGARFIFSASIMEYECIELMRAEGLPGIGTIYSAGKLAADIMARTLAASQDVEYISAIISNVYGPGERSPRLINSTIRKLLRKEHVAFTPGDQMYDFIYITDAAEAFYRIGLKGRSGSRYYVGSMEPRPLKEYLIALRDCIDQTLEIGLGDIPFQGVSLDYATQFNAKALNHDTGFCPLVSFQEGIRLTTEWIEVCNHTEFYI